MNLVRLYKLNNLGIDIPKKKKDIIDSIISNLTDLKKVRIKDLPNSFYFTTDNKCIANYFNHIIHYNYLIIRPNNHGEVNLNEMDELIAVIMKKKYNKVFKIASILTYNEVKYIEDLYEKEYESGKTL